ILPVTCARDERDRAPRDKLADENHTAPPGIRRFSPYIETQIHFFKVAVQRDRDTEKTRVEKQKSDHAEKGFMIIEVNLCATRNQRREQARIDDIIQHGEVTPVSSEKWLHVMILRLRRAYRINRPCECDIAQQIVQAQEQD